MLLLHLAALASAGVLLAFTVRRALLLGASLAPRRRFATPPQTPPTLSILVPCRNEAATLPRLLTAIDQLEYSRAHLRATVVDDGSSDGTAAAARDWAAGRPWANVISLPHSVGKGQALNAALATPAGPEAGPSESAPGDARNEIIVIYDADHRPAPSSLQALVAPFADPRVGGASGQMRVVNGGASPAAAYTAIESLVNQFVTMGGKDRLDLAPALLGSNCAYRRTALETVGGFTGGALLEDSDLSVALPLAGWRTRFVPASLSEHHAPVSLRGYVQQHLRWNRGFQQVTGNRLPEMWRNPRASLGLKLELTFFALGYADRLALLAGGFFTLVDFIWPGTFGFPWLAWAAYFGVPALEMVAALILAGEPPAAFLRLSVVPVFFSFDLAIALWSAAAGVLRRPARWTATERPDGHR